MTTELELYRDTLSQPDVIREGWSLAQKICQTDFVPKPFRGKPDAVMAALLTGREIGLGPMTALQRIHVIEGKAGLDAQGMRAQVLAAGHELWVEESTPERCVAAGRRRGSDHTQTVTWTIQEARTAGLTNKSNWKSYARQMLQARATAELCRLIAPDALGGLAYSSEELEDERPATITRARRTAAQEPADLVSVTTTAVIPPQAATAATQPSWDDDNEPVDAEIIPDPPARTVNHQWDRTADTDDGGQTTLLDDGEAATPAQVRKMSAMFSGLGWDNDQIDAYILEHTGSRTDSRKAMTRQEASRAIDQLTETNSHA